jgi:hypothetical protein
MDLNGRKDLCGKKAKIDILGNEVIIRLIFCK